MPRHLRYRHTLRYPQDLGIEIEVALWLAVIAVHLQQLSILCRPTLRERQYNSYGNK
jgi:hypothetical protein